jgi:WD40 repeat protein
LKTCRRFVIVVAASILIGGVADAGGLRKIWEFSVPNGNSAGALPVFALSFSPDGHQIGAVVGRSYSEKFVLVLDASTPQVSNRKVAINPMVVGSDEFSNQLSWSPTGRQILVGGTLVELSSGNSCSLPKGTMAPGFMFAGPTRVAAEQRKPMRLLFFDLDCNPAAQLDLGDDLWNLYDASAERSLVLIWRQHYRGVGSIEWNISAQDADTQKPLARLPLLDRARFADSGKGVCGVGGAEWHRTVECVDVDTGKRIGVTTGWSAPDVRMASHGRKAVVSDYSRKFDWTDLVSRVGALKRRVVWDFEAGKQLASWHPRSQTVFLGGQSQPYVFAISPDGKYLIEGGAGVLALYRIEP